MKVILCLSDGGGMMFNKRRQSRDKALIEDIGKLCADGVVFISDFSLPLFEDGVADVIAVSNPLSAAGVGDYAFVENLQLHDFADKIEEMIIYKWNRVYPKDLTLDLYPDEIGFKLCESVDFKGQAHEKITREIWR